MIRNFFENLRDKCSFIFRKCMSSRVRAERCILKCGPAKQETSAFVLGTSSLRFFLVTKDDIRPTIEKKDQIHFIEQVRMFSIPGRPKGPSLPLSAHQPAAVQRIFPGLGSAASRFLTNGQNWAR